MTMSLQRLREELRRAADAVARADSASATVNPAYTQQGFSEAKLTQIQRALIASAHKHLAIVRSAALQKFETTGLPGLPVGQSNDATRSTLATIWMNLGEVETLRGDARASLAAYRNAAEFAPDDVEINAQIADMLESQHELDSARAHAKTALRFDPTNSVAALALTRVLLRQESFAEAERTALSLTEASGVAAEDAALAWSLVGEARDRLGDTASAFEAFTKGNLLMLRRHGDARFNGHPAYPANVRVLTQFVERTSTPDAKPFSFATPAPVFLIGFPRSGTTLVEQVLSSHASITCLGETDYLFEAMSAVLKDGDLFQRVATLTADEIDTVRTAYQRLVLKDHPTAHGQLIVDKHPLHITLLPLINKIFPDAKIIHVRRDPRDVVLSCYQQCFGINVATMQFLELDRTAGYFDAVTSLMLTCTQKLSLDLHEIEYCNVVDDLEREARQVATFLNVAFEPEMLRFNETARTRTISSASARQVIDPIYDRSIGRWRRYKRELAPVLPLLDKWARRLGYED
jgi:tetratricopeptide (TPR) repeat protein